MQHIIFWYLLSLLALAHYIKPLDSQTHIYNISCKVLGNRGLPAAAELGHLLASPWTWEVSVNIPCPPTVFLRCFLLLPSPAPVPSCWLSPSWASQLSLIQGTTHGSRNSGCPDFPAASASVSAGCSKPSPSDASSDLTGGPEIWPSPKAHCIQASADPSDVSSPPAVSHQLPCSSVMSAPPEPAGRAKLNLDSLPIPISKP